MIARYLRPWLGARFMDRRQPGWYRKINTRQLHIAHSDRCVLGQLYGDYYRGLRVLDTGTLLGALLGMHELLPASSFREYDALTTGWVREIARRIVRDGDIGRKITRREYEKPLADPVEQPETAPEEVPELVPA